ncbi:TetR family transcriptional regulator [Pseudonocardia sulfidoxydans NBRC 16205]|uniref:TetR family transcriptional regulator n=1 Tax=Pseudonocardia sulfidoxydans NBRC 16205 TaxID=1223511 RepID=A0A511DDN1_9PSEU|nr:TetR/AcrR family transcriptional regulator [Pseudonocardia sulfidoxydans]GEL22919.1 TetR family transcriptional regulator [Pseudonocardia sulfidoxydans NBRC 16205]
MDGGSSRHLEIVQAAARLFDERGYHHTSMDDIATAVGIKKPTLYHHVPSKGRILVWIHDDLADRLLTRLRERIGSGAPPAAILLGVLEDHLELLDREPSNLRCYYEHRRELPPEDQANSRARRDEYFAATLKVVEDGGARGDFAVTDPRLTTLAFFGICNWSYQWYRPGGAMSAKAIAVSFWQCFLSGVAATCTGPAP